MARTTTPTAEAPASFSRISLTGMSFTCATWTCGTHKVARIWSDAVRTRVMILPRAKPLLNWDLAGWGQRSHLGEIGDEKDLAEPEHTEGAQLLHGFEGCPADDRDLHRSEVRVSSITDALGAPPSVCPSTAVGAMRAAAVGVGLWAAMAPGWPGRCR